MFLLIFAFIQVCFSEECPNLYSRFSKDHSYCKAPNSACNIIRSNVNRDEIGIILTDHNKLRSQVASGKDANMPSASNMMQMVWDDELAAVAQAYANQCQFKHDCSDCRRVQNFGVGQNLAIQIASNGISAPPSNWSSAIKCWYDEVEFFNKNLIHPFKVNSAYGHFTQLAWANTWRIGCGYVSFKEGASFKQLYVCNYGPGGNFIDQSLYEVGTPCSNCPANSCCDESCGGRADFLGLCKMIDNEAPISKPKDTKTFFYCDFKNQAHCDHTMIGKRGWQIFQTLSGNYIGIVLNTGEESTLVFQNRIKPRSKNFCFVINYRKGANVDGNQDGGTATEIFNLNNYKVQQDLPTFPTKHQFSKFSMSLSWDAETELQVKFSVLPGEQQQFFEIQSLYATDGSCS